MRHVAFPLAILLVAAACGASAPDSPEGGDPVEGEAEPAGPVSGAELRGEWVLTHFALDDPAPDEPVITLAFTEKGIAGGSGCNRYFGSPQPGDGPADLSFGPIGGTRMACPPPAMELEQRYLAALGSVQSFGFRSGKLALTYRDGDTTRVMLFAPAPPDAP